MQIDLLDSHSAQEKGSPGQSANASGSPEVPGTGAKQMSQWRQLVRRRHYWVNRHAQLPATAMALLATLFFVVMFNWAMFEKTSARRNIISEVRPLVEQRLREQDQSFHSFLIFLSVAFIVCLVAGMVLFTHRSAGPVHRVRAHIRRLTAGDTNCDVTLRKKDHFKELAEDFNQMVRSFRERDQREAEELEALAYRLKAPSADLKAVADVLLHMARDKAGTRDESTQVAEAR